ncbi:MAG: hydroxymethylbutenyl pyrophosphate reductase [Anaerocolumna sp.]|jgi:4-hydroxy-3-methylbut-2-enyl diphosphate reductase|nr:hydroxymethylbutenyl pyrophosphate reductase [Anaerocolumna sp.]
MEVVLAKTAGFCFGVKRAIDVAFKEADQNKKVYTFGSIIHNEEVVNELADKGVEVIHTKEELKGISEGTIIIRSHGVSKEIYDIIHAQGLKLVDATCPYVLKIHKLVKEQSEKNHSIIIVGNDMHPEVEGIIGWCMGNFTIVKDIEDAKKLDLSLDKPVSIVAQTTYNYKKFEDIVEIISKKGYDINVLNTICNATQERQSEVKELAKALDAMIVIGGQHSSNTQKLYEISKLECENTYYIQTLRDLDLNKIKSFRSVGITAGASTPNNIIKEVHTACQN